jgi:hypothetical protein
MSIGFMTIAVLLVAALNACHQGLRVRSAGADASPDVAPRDRGVDPAAADGAADLVAPGTPDAGSLSTPKGFRIVNATAGAVYVDMGDPVKCRAQDALGWQTCAFFGSYCLADCQFILPGGQCCVYCEQATPTLLTVPAGGSRTVAWNGNLFATRADTCSDCKCQEQSAVGPETLEAAVSAYDEYYCVWGQLCAEQPDGTIPYAAPQNSPQDHAVQFTIPSADDVVVITIPAELSVEQILANTDALLGAQLTVVGKVLMDVRQKPGNWPAPALSSFVLQDGGDLPMEKPFIQLYSTNDLSAYLHTQVRVTAYLRGVMIQYPNGESHQLLYLEVLSIAAT